MIYNEQNRKLINDFIMALFLADCDSNKIFTFNEKQANIFEILNNFNALYMRVKSSLENNMPCNSFSKNMIESLYNRASINDDPNKVAYFKLFEEP